MAVASRLNISLTFSIMDTYEFVQVKVIKKNQRPNQPRLPPFYQPTPLFHFFTHSYFSPFSDSPPSILTPSIPLSTS
jgi:hypothetical protein